MLGLRACDHLPRKVDCSLPQTVSNNGWLQLPLRRVRRTMLHNGGRHAEMPQLNMRQHSLWLPTSPCAYNSQKFNTPNRQWVYRWDLCDLRPRTGMRLLCGYVVAYSGEGRGRSTLGDAPSPSGMTRKNFLRLSVWTTRNLIGWFSAKIVISACCHWMSDFTGKKCAEFDFGSDPDAAGGAYSVPPDSVARLKGANFQGEERGPESREGG